MQSELQSSFQRVEQALQRLIDSIAAYNPSITAAEELSAADEAVNQDLKKLVIHQRNYQRIEELRRQTDAYDSDIKNKIRQISETRKDLLNIPAYNTADDPAREIDVSELLRYAKFISKTTVAPTLPKQEAPQPPPTPVKEEAVKPLQSANGTSTPPPEPTQDQTDAQGAESAGMKLLGADNKGWLGQTLHFEPWPEHLTVQRGALGAIQRMVEAGQDPASVLTAEERAEAERRKVEEEEREEKERAGRREGIRRSGAGLGRRETVEDVFNPDDM